uniref:Uncharacterized protein n=1 Tax=Ciona savignyi TaxID=51511 RepID=H2YTP8_CIOSA
MNKLLLLTVLLALMLLIDSGESRRFYRRRRHWRRRRHYVRRRRHCRRRYSEEVQETEIDDSANLNDGVEDVEGHIQILPKSKTK